MNDMTEKKAAECWCPFSRAPANGIHGDVVLNRDSDGTADTGSLCMGSRCMAWRWTFRNEVGGKTHGGPGTGYCGLAGPIRA